MMKKIHVLVLGALVAMGMSSCIKDGEPYDWRAQYELEKPIIEEYAKAHMIDPIFDEETGIWYEITSPGDPTSFEYKAIYDQTSDKYYPEPPNIWVNYTGKLMDGTTFDMNDETNGAKLSFNQIAVQAWIYIFFPEKIYVDDDGEQLEEPIDFIGFTASGLTKGAKVRFVTPSYLAYANASSAKIPANSPLDFQIEVLDIASPNGTGN